MYLILLTLFWQAFYKKLLIHKIALLMASITLSCFGQTNKQKNLFLHSSTLSTLSFFYQKQTLLTFPVQYQSRKTLRLETTNIYYANS